MDEFREVVPGVSVGPGVTVSIDHPDPCWFIRNEENTGSLGDVSALYVWSSEEAAKAFLTVDPVQGAVVEGPLTWDELVDRFSGTYAEVTVDHTGSSGFYSTAPLRKGI